MSLISRTARKDTQTFAVEIRMGPFSTHHGKDEGDHRTRYFGTIAILPIEIRGTKPYAADPPLCPDEEVRLLPTVGESNQGGLWGLVAQSKGTSNVFAMDDYLTEHCHDRRRWVIGGRSSGPSVGAPAHRGRSMTGVSRRGP